MKKQNYVTKHVPLGMKVCRVCCDQEADTYISPGFVRGSDIVSPLSMSRFGVCEECAGTGVAIRVTEEEKAIIHRARFADFRDCGQRYTENEIEMLKLAVAKWKEIGSPQGAFAEYLVEKLEIAQTPLDYSRKLAGINIFDFEPIDLPDELTWVTAEFLADIYDMVIKFGNVAPEDGISRFAISEEYSISAKDDNSSIIITSSADEKGAHFFGIKGGSRVYWPKSLSPKWLLDRMELIDKYCADKDLIDKETGARIRIDQDPDYRLPKLSVEKNFQTRGAAMPAFGRDPEVLRQEFDRPEDLAIIQDSFGTVSLCHKRDVEYLERRRLVAERVMAKNGIELDNIVDMDMAKVLELRSLIDTEMLKIDN